jgi:hypothetical protein
MNLTLRTERIVQTPSAHLSSDYKTSTKSEQHVSTAARRPALCAKHPGTQETALRIQDCSRCSTSPARMDGKDFSCERLVELDIDATTLRSSYTSLPTLCPLSFSHRIPTNSGSCPCPTQFCYLCALPWKTCHCPRWNEDRQFAHATQIIARKPSEIQANDRSRALAAAVEDLRNRRHYNHESWRYVEGQHQCEECAL